MSGEIFHQTRLLRAPSNLALNSSREGAATASLGSLCQCLTTLMVKNFFLISHLNLPSFSLEPFPLVLSVAYAKQCLTVQKSFSSSTYCYSNSCDFVIIWILAKTGCLVSSPKNQFQRVWCWPLLKYCLNCDCPWRSFLVVFPATFLYQYSVFFQVTHKAQAWSCKDFGEWTFRDSAHHAPG